jgi:hypothetical protein
VSAASAGDDGGALRIVIAGSLTEPLLIEHEMLVCADADR